MYNSFISLRFLHLNICKLIENDRDPKWVKILSRYDIEEIYNLLVIERLVFAPLVIDCIQSALWKKNANHFFILQLGVYFSYSFNFVQYSFIDSNYTTGIHQLLPYIWYEFLYWFCFGSLSVSFFKFSNMSIFKIEQNIPICGWEYARMFR